MLVLTRKLQEQILIGQDITITVLRVKGNTVRIGIDAPNEVRVVRAELPRYDNASTTASEPAPVRQTPLGYDHTQPSQPQASEIRKRTTGLAPLVERVSQRSQTAAVLG